MDIIKNLILRRLLSKPVPERYSLTASPEVTKRYDWISVTGATENHGDVLLRSIGPNNGIAYFFWNEDDPNATAQEATCQLADVDWDSLEVRRTFRTWEIKYSSLKEAYFSDLLGIPRFSWMFQKIREPFIRPIKPNYRLELLRNIVNLYNQSKPINIQSLLLLVYGGGVRLSNDQHRFQRELRLMLSSLVVSDDIIEHNERNDRDFIGEQGDYIPAPQAVTTLANYELERTRHRDTVSLSRAQLFLGLAMLCLAAATLYLQINGN